MAVDTAPISIDQYKSTVPLVPMTQIPQQDLQSNQAPKIFSKKGGIAEFADTAMKGLLKGLQMKEERKYKTAEAVMSAQDAGIGAAKKNYDDMLMTKGAFEADGKTPKAETQAAYQAWQQSVNAAAAQRQAFAVPDQKPKQSKGTKKKDANTDQVQAGAGFGPSLKQFFERNPHIVPELAIIGMKSQVTPYGQMGPEQQQQKQQYDAAQRIETDEKVSFAARQTISKYGGKTNLTPAQQEELDNAKAVLTPIVKPTSTEREYTSPDGKQRDWYVPGYQLQGWNATANPGTAGQPKVGTKQDAIANALKGYGVDEKTPPGVKAKYEKFLNDWFDHKAAQSSTSTSGSTVDSDGNRVSTSKTSRGSAAPKPQDYGLPANTPLPGEDGQPQAAGAEAPKGAGRMSKPPAAPGAGRGTMTAAPTVDGKPTLVSANRTMNTETKEKGMYDKATAAYQKALANNKAKAPDKASLDAANAQAEQAYAAAKAQIVLWKAAQVKAVGGNPWKATANGGKYGTMDGVNWVDVTTGMPYQER